MLSFVFLEPREVFDECIIGFINESVCYDKKSVLQYLIESYNLHIEDPKEAEEMAIDFFEQQVLSNPEDLENPPVFLDTEKWQQFCLKYSKENIRH